MKIIYCDYCGEIEVDDDFECDYCGECDFCYENDYIDDDDDYYKEKENK